MQQLLPSYELQMVRFQLRFKSSIGFIFCSFRKLKFEVLINCNAFDWELLLKINTFLLYTDEMQITAINGEIFITQDKTAIY